MSSLAPGVVEVHAEPPEGAGGMIPTRLAAWKSVRITRRLDALAGEFSLELAPDSGVRLSRGWKVAIALDGTEVLRGHVETLQVSEGEGPASIVFGGRDLAGDLVDSTPDTATSEWRDLWLDELLGKLVADRAGLVLDRTVLRALGPKISLFRLNPGESFHRAIERACRMRGALPYSLPTGEVAIAPPFGARHEMSIVAPRQPALGAVGAPASRLVAERGAQLSSVLQWSRNIKRYGLSFNDTDRFRTYVVKGQAGGLDVELGVAALQAEGRAFDLTVRQGRTLVLVAETNAWGDDVQSRAEWEAAWRAAQSAKLTVEVPGWRPNRGAPLWAVNQFVKVGINKIAWDGPTPALEPLLAFDPTLKAFLAGNLLVNALEFQHTSAGSGGTATTLELVRSDAYKRLPEIEAEPQLEEQD